MELACLNLFIKLMVGVSKQFSGDQTVSLLIILLRIEFLNIILLTLE